MASLQTIIAELYPIMTRGDVAGFHDACVRLDRAGRTATKPELDDAVIGLAEILTAWPRGIFGKLALLAAALIRRGASPKPLAEPVPPRAVAIMRQRMAFDRYLPSAPEGRSMTDVVALVRTVAPKLKPETATGIALSWFDTGDWVELLLAALCRREFRDATELLPEIAALATGLGDRVRRAPRLAALARVLDDEQLIALDRSSGRGFRLTMSGVGDNYQLHTLVAARLIGELVPGEPLPDGWIARATTAAPGGPPITRRFRLVDGHGTYIDPEGIPADIGKLAGRRVIVLQQPGGVYQWDLGRVHEGMAGRLTLDRELPPDETHSWLSRLGHR